ncbi:54S ribosomal protein L36, mitochondrial [Candidozyma auris]|uniref:Ribosomal protein bL31m N-terminal domain-containing protein n=1 Tax=Candidozyma auris TaxID=498019 RepID=A0A2H1A214_CANAR|nr:mitochondrial 54S ribosomal protein YmL36 [[Candida] auris]PIS55906.1 hypothetical protein CJI97_001144 [[Candida] auris]PIS56914.1 hypothetical protein B9J08_001460 [[Candida] auris]PSK75937.1 hypothetical protein CJJ07_004267 [[Candida] auris]QEL61566.1 hypothetical protein CJJ09_003713 [[Candida] auris]QEO20377.1 hypothetical_protein [[Candida] auris]
MFPSARSITSGVHFVNSVRHSSNVRLSGRRVMKTIKMGKARPAIFHQFETFVELSDGSVVKRRSQAPKDEIRMISDQRSSPMWNPTRDDLDDTDPNAVGKVDRFRKRFGGFDGAEEASEKLSFQERRKQANEQKENLFDLLGENATEVKGGKVQPKWAKKKK